LWRHALPNAALPVLTVLGLQLAALLGGALITEKVFGRQGLGTLLLDAIATRDHAVVQGCVLVIGSLYLLVTGAVDSANAWLDPRLRSGQQVRS
jgi:peptide/nickel transport system permease protein